MWRYWRLMKMGALIRSPWPKPSCCRLLLFFDSIEHMGEAFFLNHLRVMLHAWSCGRPLLKQLRYGGGSERRRRWEQLFNARLGASSTAAVGRNWLCPWHLEVDVATIVAAPTTAFVFLFQGGAAAGCRLAGVFRF